MTNVAVKRVQGKLHAFADHSEIASEKTTIKIDKDEVLQTRNEEHPMFLRGRDKK